MRRKGETDYLVMIGERLREARRRSGLTQQELHEATQVGLETISRTENGKCDVSISTLVRLANGLGTDLSALLAPMSEREERERQEELRKLSALLGKADLSGLRLLRLVLSLPEREGEAERRKN